MGKKLVDLVKLREAINTSTSTAEVAEKIGCHKSTVRHYMQKWSIPHFTGAPSGVSRRLDYDHIESLVKDGLTATQIALRLGERRATISAIIGKLGLAKPARRFTDIEIDMMFEMLEDGASYREVARTLNTRTATVMSKFPGYGWTPQQSGEFGMMMRYQGLHDLKITHVPQEADRG